MGYFLFFGTALKSGWLSKPGTDAAQAVWESDFEQFAFYLALNNSI